MDHPYTDLPPDAYWRNGVSTLSPLEFDTIYKPKFTVAPRWKIAAAGSCFAQHIGRQFKQRGYNFLDAEPAPPGMSDADKAKFGYDLYSARYGNIYSIRQMLQLVHRAYNRLAPSETCWEQEGRFYDPFRPAIPHNGFATRDELETDVSFHLSAVRRLVEEADLFVFTFGLTEGWVTSDDEIALPTCPGTIAGSYDPEKYAFKNYTFSEVMADAKRFINFARRRNPKLRFLFTVSPVPLTATASGNHVLPATVYSKSVLRAVCGELAQTYDFIDYFPSYELVASHPMRAMFFEPNLRSVSPVGVSFVMDRFFGQQPAIDAKRGKDDKGRATDEDEAVCEEAILEAFAK